MNDETMKSVYGPVGSWRLGKSLGIDPICSEKKICSLDCIYCQLGKGLKTCKRQNFISLEKLKEDLKIIKNVEVEVITFSGTGESTLAKNLNEMVFYIKTISSLPLAILTNSSLFFNKDVRDVLNKLDIVVAKLDAPNETLFQKINRPYKKIKFKSYLAGIKKFRKKYSGKFALQMMFVEENKNFADEMVKIAREIKPNEIQINTPLRPCAVKPLTKSAIKKIKSKFSCFKNVISVYEAKRPKVIPLDLKEVQKRKRPKP
jgi:wyosine [tRNA(Phe)-imidazoG37] synthetase (radical SAM superfamily)